MGANSGARCGSYLSFRADRVERYYFDSHIVQPDTYKPLLREGLAQSGGNWMPNVKVYPRFDSFFEEVLPTVFQVI